MNGYIVRLNAEADRPREIVGFFLAEDPQHLERLIDECCPANSCEYLPLGPGGIFWGRTDYVVPNLADEDVDGLPAHASVTESWHGPLYVDRSDWVRIAFPPCAANEP